MIYIMERFVGVCSKVMCASVSLQELHKKFKEEAAKAHVSHLSELPRLPNTGVRIYGVTDTGYQTSIVQLRSCLALTGKLNWGVRWFIPRPHWSY